MQGEKFLVLRKKFRQPTLDLSSPTLSFSGFPTSPISTPDLGTPTSPLREPPPYRPPPIASLSPVSNTSSPIRRYSLEPSVGLPIVVPISKSVEPPIGLPSVSPLNPPIGLPNVYPVESSSAFPRVYSVVQENIPSSPLKIVNSNEEPNNAIASPPVPPRRKTQDKIKITNKENQNTEKGKNESTKVCTIIN